MDWNVYLLLQKPHYQALLFLVLTPIVILILQPKSADNAWVIAVLSFVLFLIVNSVFLWFDESPWSYFFYSIGCALGYILVIAVMVPALLNLMRLDGSGESAMAFLVLMYHPPVLLLVMAAKWMVTKWL